jgi:hypothetical protein
VKLKGQESGHPPKKGPDTFSDKDFSEKPYRAQLQRANILAPE